MAAEIPRELHRLLTTSLPRENVFTFHYVSSTPTECDPVFAAAPGATPEPTTWESQLLSVSIERENSTIQVFAIEVLIYTTDRLITIFVSKADSTGYLHLANFPKSSKSPVRVITSAFLEYLIAWKRGSRRLVLSLFARAQAQYLFPGSVENSGKHVLDDRQLIRWWCRIVDDVLGKVKSRVSQINGTDHSSQAAPSGNGPDVQAYLVIPGLDAYETRTYVPRGSTWWKAAQSPLKQLAISPDVPERCLIPRFPDDPKARFAIDLDDELPENAIQLGDVTKPPEPSKTGKWRSVNSLEQFWELMAFRQECAAGRVVGFLWAVFEPVEEAATVRAEAKGEGPGTNGRSSEAANGSEGLASVEATVQEASTDVADTSRDAASAAPKPTTDKGVLLTSDQPPKLDPPGTAPLPVPAAEEPPVLVSPSTRPPTALIVLAAKYSAITLLLDKLDYADLAIAKISTHRFLVHAGEQAGLSPGADKWGMEIKGALVGEVAETNQETTTKSVPTMLVGRKRKKEKVEEQTEKKLRVDD